MNQQTENLKDQLEPVKKYEHADLSKVKGKPIAVVAARSSYIPIEEFKELFESVGKLVASDRIVKLIFDKRQLNVFHQPSMEWYFTDWKERMWHLGLKSHRKILPDNQVFKQSVKIGREKINSENPNLKFHQMDIKYKDTLQQAIDS